MTGCEHELPWDMCRICNEPHRVEWDTPPAAAPEKVWIIEDFNEPRAAEPVLTDEELEDAARGAEHDCARSFGRLPLEQRMSLASKLRAMKGQQP